MASNTFDILLLIARPAAGKSEIIDHLKKTPVEKRIRQFHIGDIVEIDDFPMLWTWYEEDEILTKLGHPRLHTNEHGYFIDNYLWDLLIRRLNLEYQKKRRDYQNIHNNKTTIIEFARGSEHGGFARAFQHLSSEIVSKMAILYIQVSYEESLRKNRVRFNPNRPDSILEHGLPDDKLKKLYRYVDWDQVSAADPKFITIQGFQVPYFVFKNEDDITTVRGQALDNRLEASLDALWNLYNQGLPND